MAADLYCEPKKSNHLVNPKTFDLNAGCSHKPQSNTESIMDLDKLKLNFVMVLWFYA